MATLATQLPPPSSQSNATSPFGTPASPSRPPSRQSPPPSIVSANSPDSPPPPSPPLSTATALSPNSPPFPLTSSAITPPQTSLPPISSSPPQPSTKASDPPASSPPPPSSSKPPESSPPPPSSSPSLPQPSSPPPLLNPSVGSPPPSSSKTPPPQSSPSPPPLLSTPPPSPSSSVSQPPPLSLSKSPPPYSLTPPPSSSSPPPPSSKSSKKTPPPHSSTQPTSPPPPSSPPTLSSPPPSSDIPVSPPPPFTSKPPDNKPPSSIPPVSPPPPSLSKSLSPQSPTSPPVTASPPSPPNKSTSPVPLLKPPDSPPSPSSSNLPNKSPLNPTTSSPQSSAPKGSPTPTGIVPPGPPLSSAPPSASPSLPIGKMSPPTTSPNNFLTPNASSSPQSGISAPYASPISKPNALGVPNSISHGGSKITLVVAISVGSGLIVLTLILIFLLVRKHKRNDSGLNRGYVMPSPLGSFSRVKSSATEPHSSAPPIVNDYSGDFVNVPPEPGGLGNSKSWFAYEELHEATNGFSDQNLLGEGGFGCVYKGVLSDGRVIAVKQLKVGGGQGEREFKAEVEIITRIHHRHLVSLVGYCISGSRRLLVYDYVPNNTLYFHLHGTGNPALDWTRRVKVASGAARGLAYLHEDCHPRIIHRDIKSSNILLDSNFEARVSDFGLAKLALDTNTHVSTRVMGTFGYMAPEYASSGKLTEKSDVYSFGVVLLELITGRKPVDTSQPLGDESLVEWARPLLGHALENKTFDDLEDPRLEKNYIGREMFHMIEAAAACVRHSAARRPKMGQVVRVFDSIASSDLMNGMKLGESQIQNSALQSEEIRLFQGMAFGSQDYSSHFLSEDS